MRFLKYFSQETYIGYITAYLVLPIYQILKYRIIPERLYLKLLFARRLGYHLDLKKPSTFNEKMQWLKLNDRTKLHTICADKYAVREFVKNELGEEYLIPLVSYEKRSAEITPKELPDYPIIIKANHNSSGGAVILDKSTINWVTLRRKFSLLLRRNFYYNKKEWQYKNITAGIVVEKLLLDENNKIPNDYKLHCFNGKLEYIQVDMDRQKNHQRNIYDSNWNLLEFQWIYPNGPKIDKPKKLEQMKILAEKIAKNFLFVRVDFYYVNGKIFFGEITFHPESGLGLFIPQEWDLHLGEKLNLSNDIS